MQWVKNRNNIIDMYLKKQIEQYEREKDLRISLIDQDRLDIHDFLKHLKKCESDALPEAKHWLGERTPSGRRLERTPIRNIQTAPPVVAREEPERTQRNSDRRNPVDEEAAKYEHKFRSRPKAELVNRAQTLCSIFNRRNVLAGLSSVRGAWESETDKDDGEKSDILAGSVTFKDGELDSRRAMGSAIDVSKLEEDDNMSRSDYYRILPPGGGPPYSRTRGQTGDFMKDLLVHKCRKRKKARVPLEDRIASFYEEIEQYKVKDDSPAANSEWDTQRRWTLLTKGVKAALEAESDDEADNPLNTV